MLSFAAIAPHPPIIIPNVGKNNLDLVKKTIAGMNKLEKKLRKNQPDIIIIISPHGTLFADAFSINLSEKYTGNFKTFGDLNTNLNFNGDVGLVHRIFEKLEAKMPVVMLNQPNLDHGTLVPLFYLASHLTNCSIIPIGYSLLDNNKQIEFGERLKEEILLSNKKIAVIASGDLSHRLTFDAPDGYNPQGKIFDDKLVSLLKKKLTKQILDLDAELIEGAGQCGLRSILILLGIIKDINYKPELLSYEGPFGVGYLVMNFKL
jgi:AmmeMemoRadiSam system protein B